MTFRRSLIARYKLLAVVALATTVLFVGPVSSATAVGGNATSASHAAAAKKVVVPKMVGKTAYSAKNALNKIGLRYKYSAPKGSFVILSKDWTVIKQSPKAKALVAPGTKVKLSVVKTATLRAAAPKPSTPAAPALSVAQQQAFISAKGYLASGIGFSYQGLVDQLSSAYGSGFSVADATVAVDALNADWNAQAVISAKGYLSTGMGFSHASLLQQLSSSFGGKFTPDQAAYAVAQVGL